MRKCCSAASKKFVLLINPKLLVFSKPFLLALIIGGASFILFTAYSGYLLSQCHRQSYTTTTRSEMIQWFVEDSPLDPMNNFHKNWKCLHYTAKLVSANGMLHPERSSHDSHPAYCEKTGECAHRVSFQASESTRYEKCDIGTVKYKTADGFKLEPPGTPESAEVTQDFVWMAAHDLHKVAGGIEEANEILRIKNDGSSNPVEKDHPMYMFLFSKPYMNFNRQLAKSEDMRDFDINAPENQLTDSHIEQLLHEPSRSLFVGRVRSRSKGGGEFPELCRGSDKGSSFADAYAKEFDAGARRRRTTGSPGSDRCTGRSASDAYPLHRRRTTFQVNLTRHVFGFEFKLMRQAVAMPAYDAYAHKNELDMRVELPRFVKESRHLQRSMFCNPADYDDVIMYRGSLWTETMDGSFSCEDPDSENWDDPRCTLVRKCDLTGLAFNSEPGVKIEPTEQPEYGSFLAVYEVCPPLLDTLGTAFGFLGQLEMIITVLVILLFLSCGCVTVQGENSVESSLQQRVVGRIQVAMDIADEEQNHAVDAAHGKQGHDIGQPGDASVPLSPHADANIARMV